jgi:hypothetical protein
MKRLWVIRGKGRCENSVAYVLAATEQEARLRLLRNDASPYYVIDSIHLFTVAL